MNNMLRRFRMLVITVLICFSFCGCGKKNDNSVEKYSQNQTQEETKAEVTTKESEATKEETVSPTEAVEDNSKELYDAFLAGTEKVYTDKYEFIHHNQEGEPFLYYGENNDGYTIEDFFAKVIEVEDNGFDGGPLEEVNYTYLDCGMDGIPELAIHAAFSMEYGEQLTREYVIKAFDGKLQLCYQNSSYYRDFTEIANEYGKVHSALSYGATASGESYGYLDKDGRYELCYYLYLSYDGANNLDERLLNEIEKSTEDFSDLYLRAYSFEIYDDSKDYSEYEKNRYYCGEKEADEPSNGVDFGENVRKLKGLCEAANVKYYTLAEIEKLISDREKELGLADVVINSSSIQWKKFDINYDNVNRSNQTDVIEIHPFSEANFMWETENFCHITDNETKIEYHLSNDAQIKEGVPCFEEGYSTMEWLPIYLGYSDIVDADPDKYVGLCFTMGDIWGVIIDENNNITSIEYIGYWD